MSAVMNALPWAVDGNFYFWINYTQFKDSCALFIKLSHLLAKITLHTKKEEMRA